MAASDRSRPVRVTARLSPADQSRRPDRTPDSGPPVRILDRGCSRPRTTTRRAADSRSSTLGENGAPGTIRTSDPQIRGLDKVAKFNMLRDNDCHNPLPRYVCSSSGRRSRGTSGAMSARCHEPTLASQCNGRNALYLSHRSGSPRAGDSRWATCRSDRERPG